MNTRTAFVNAIIASRVVARFVEKQAAKDEKDSAKGKDEKDKDEKSEPFPGAAPPFGKEA